ncbi:mitochondrial fission regulator 2 [Lepisosteus oculatus]|uniref:Mitochondrial fission regulator n=1 Tax=Lepisosteus oculatus TaxID=7918 RepID=W5NH75_LEPOC|nr:PREDICTED: mitochondrial fission regulator 2 [Lepisosteus oculatus]XP_015203517.1 PREDICTED: mitochondrial fission regulator 2 [Lepisosteus oculatus]XP_015203522.1 PREDICTED: mitochondrial fission regulator 2 [Lepisosteus oculatus]
MSLFADLLDILRYILDYFGVPPDMLLPVWENQLCGQYRSIIRMIGTNLPLSPCPRVHFQIPLQACARPSTLNSSDENCAVPSFADVMWVAHDEGESYARLRNEVHPLDGKPVAFFTAPPTCLSVPSQHAQGVLEKKTTQPPTNSDALKKITALEDELLRLRAQIAMIVTTPPGPLCSEYESARAPGTPRMSRLPQVLTSTPVPAPPPAPPPLAPPLPPAPSCATPDLSVTDLIRQRRAASRTEQSHRERALPSSSSLPSMLDVLKDMNKVRLRTVERSPGGTPVMKKDKKIISSADPAALIAAALKRKFAHRYKEDSFDKENRPFETSPFGSPEIPRLPYQVTKGTGKLPPLKSDLLSLTPTIKANRT